MKLSRNHIHVANVIIQLVAISGIAICMLLDMGRTIALVLLAILLISIMLREMTTARIFPQSEHKKPENPVRTPSAKHVKEASEPMAETVPDNNSAKEEKLHLMFEEFLITNQNFLQPGLTIVNVAEALGTNKTYLSKIVNSSYGMTFPELMNSLRIDYAEQYILHNRDAKQADVAMACGFANASAFNNTFKKLVGITPKAWLDEKTSR